MIEYLRARAGRENDIVDFANYVFSQAHRPHDFKRLIPKVYAHDGHAPLHLIAEEAGKIRAMLALLPVTLKLGAERLNGAYMGTVSVHPYARGEGHMKRLMQLADEWAEEQRLDFVALSGKRKRYNYFGYERGGMGLRFKFGYNTVAHGFDGVQDQAYRFAPLRREDGAAVDSCFSAYQALPVACGRSRERFLDTLECWDAVAFSVRKDDAVIGYIVYADGEITEWAVPDEDAVPVLRAFFLFLRADVLGVRVDPLCERVIAGLQPIAEAYDVYDGQMIRVKNWKRVIEASLNYKLSRLPLEEGAFAVAIDGAGYDIRVDGGRARVAETDAVPALRLSHNQAVSRLFSPLSVLTCRDGLPAWFPLPFAIPAPDAF